VLDEPRLRCLGGRLEDEVGRVDLVRDLIHQAGAHLAGRPEDSCRSAFAALRDHLPGSGGALSLDPLDPEVRGEVDLSVLRADLRENRKVAREVLDQLELSLARDLDGAVRELDVREALVG
jgi:hypothetical protein